MNGRRASPAALLRAEAGRLTAGFAGAVGILVLPLGPAIARQARAEILGLAICYPLAVLALAIHVRRRNPAGWRPAVTLFVGAFWLRMLLMVFAVNHSILDQPESRGHVGRDPYRYGVRAQAYGAVVLAAVDSERGARALKEVYQLYGRGRGDFVASDIDARGNVIANWLWAVPSGLLAAWLGSSVVLLSLPVALAGSFVVVQAWLFAARWWRPGVAAAVALYLTLAPEVLLESIWFHKNQFAMIVFLYFFELLQERWPDNGRQRLPWSRWLPAMLWLGLAAYVVRPLYVQFLVGALAYGLLRGRIQRRALRLAVDAATVAALVLAVPALELEELIRGMGQYLIGCAVGLWTMPGPSLLFAPTHILPLYFSAASGVLWPWVGGLFAVGLVLFARGQLRIHPVAVLLCFWMNVLVAAVAGTSWTGLGKRLTVVPVILVIAFEGVAVAREQPPEVRRSLTRLALGVTAAALLFHAVVSVAFYLD